MKSSKYQQSAMEMLSNARNDIKNFLINHNGEYINKNGMLPFIVYRNENVKIERLYTDKSLFGMIGERIDLGNNTIITFQSVGIMDLFAIADCLNSIAEFEE